MNYYHLLQDEQKEFLLNEVKRGRRTIFDNIMVEEKVQAIKSVDIDLLEDERNVGISILLITWILVQEIA